MCVYINVAMIIKEETVGLRGKGGTQGKLERWRKGKNDGYAVLVYEVQTETIKCLKSEAII